MRIFDDIFKKFFLGSEWRFSSKRVIFFLLFLNVITSAAVSIYIPFMKQMALEFHTTNSMMSMTIVAHLIGEFIGRLFCGPIMNFYDRKALVLNALGLALVGQFGCFIAPNIYIFICMRFLYALGASVIYIISIVVINDSFSKEDKGGILGILELYQPIAWILSPFFGCVLAELWNWRCLFLVLFFCQWFGRQFFKIYLYDACTIPSLSFSFKKFFMGYKTVLGNVSFVIYALIPGLFAGGYMIYSISTPFICSHLLGSDFLSLGDSSTQSAIFQAIPLVFYVVTTIFYRKILQRFGPKISKRVGICVYCLFGIYTTFLAYNQIPWTVMILLQLMCLQCIGSAFLVPISVLKALQFSSHASVGASAVVVFRNIIMATCISISTAIGSPDPSITLVIASVFLTVGTALGLFIARRIIRIRSAKALSE